MREGQRDTSEAGPNHPRRAGPDGWLVAVRAFAGLFAGMLAISIATMI